MEQKPTYLQELASIPIFLLGAVVLFGPGVLCWQVYQWLKTGKWSPVPVSWALEYAGFQYPYLEWRGVQKIVDAFLDLPLSVVSFVTVLCLLALLVSLMESYEALSRKRATRTRPPLG
jgi:hypothetical protein